MLRFKRGQTLTQCPYWNSMTQRWYSISPASLDTFKSNTAADLSLVFHRKGFVPYYLYQSRRYGPTISVTSSHVTVPTPGVKREDPRQPPSKLKDPHIPDGHPIDTDGRPLGHFIPDYDVELPILSFGGYSKDFEAWTEPPVFPPTTWSKIAKYDYNELEVENFPVMYEINVVYVIQILCLLILCVTISATKWELNRYYKAVRQADSRSKDSREFTMVIRSLNMREDEMWHTSY